MYISNCSQLDQVTDDYNEFSKVEMLAQQLLLWLLRGDKCLTQTATPVFDVNFNSLYIISAQSAQ